MGGHMKRFLAVVTIAVLLSAGLTSLAWRPTNIVSISVDDEMVLYMYDSNRSGVAPFVGNITDPHVRWVYNASGDIITPPMIADVNDDGRYEIIVQSETGELTVINEDGSILYSTSFGPEFPMMPAAADIDGDGRLEILAGQGSHNILGGSLDINALNGEDLSFIWNFTASSGSEHGFFASPSFHDSNGDGLLDVLLGSMNDYFYALNGLNGSLIWMSPKGLHYNRATSPMADIDNDGDQEIVSIDNAALVRLHDATTGMIEWEKQIGYGSGSSPLVADLDGDGFGEIAFYMIITGGIQVLNHDGSVLWNDTSLNLFYSAPTIADVDGDGLPDLINGNYWNHTIFAHRGFDGTLLWQTILPNNTRAQSALVSADVDGDGDIEILALGKDQDMFLLDAQTGTIEWTFSIDGPFGQPTLWDIDQDGVAEIVLSAWGGLVYVIDQAPPPNFNPRSKGYWKHQCSVDEPKENHPGITDEFAVAISENSTVFSSIQSREDICDVLLSKPGSNMTGKALQQLMALWLNIVSGYVDPAAGIDLGNLTSAGTVAEAVAEIEYILLNSHDKGELERAKDIADKLNNGIGA